MLSVCISKVSSVLYQLMTKFARLRVEVSCQHREMSCAGRQVYKLRRVKRLHHTVCQVLIVRSAVLCMQLPTKLNSQYYETEHWQYFKQVLNGSDIFIWFAPAAIFLIKHFTSSK